MLRAFGFARTRFTPFLVLATALLALAALTGCSDDDDKNPVGPGGGGTPTSTSFTGVLASPTLNAKLGITISSSNLARGLHQAGAVVIGATGTLNIVGGGTVALTGSYDTELDTLYLAGGGYVVQGTFDNTGNPPGIVGNWFGPGGEAGSFGCVLGGDTSVKVYCGQFVSTMDASYGTWNMIAFADTAIVGVAQPAEESVVFFSGTLSREETSPGIKTITIYEVDDVSGSILEAPGTLNVSTNAVAGSWSITLDTVVTNEGTWDGELCP